MTGALIKSINAPGPFQRNGHREPPLNDEEPVCQNSQRFHLMMYYSFHTVCFDLRHLSPAKYSFESGHE